MTTKGPFKIYSLVLIAMSLLAPAACKQPPASAAAAVGVELKNLHNLEGLKTAFNNDHGAPRLVLLLSPT